MATKMSPKAADLLLEMVEDLETFEFPPNSEFDMGKWGVHENDDHPPEEENYCGTSACAIGWLTTMPKWQERGLKGQWVADNYMPNRQMLVAASTGSDLWLPITARVFHINEASADFLFAELTWQNLKEFCEKVRKFVKLRQKGMPVLDAENKIRHEGRE